MIPDGWVLVPRIPSERMLTEFSGVWAPWLPKKRRELELRAYDAMLAVVPSAPSPENSALAGAERRARTEYISRKKAEAETKRAYKKLKYAWDKIRALEAENEALRSMGG